MKPPQKNSLTKIFDGKMGLWQLPKVALNVDMYSALLKRHLSIKSTHKIKVIFDYIKIKIMNEPSLWGTRLLREKVLNFLTALSIYI